MPDNFERWLEAELPRALAVSPPDGLATPPRYRALGRRGAAPNRRGFLRRPSSRVGVLALVLAAALATGTAAAAVRVLDPSLPIFHDGGSTGGHQGGRSGPPRNSVVASPSSGSSAARPSAPGKSGSAPGHTGTNGGGKPSAAPGKSGSAPGHTGTNGGGKPSAAPGKSGSAPGNTGN